MANFPRNSAIFFIEISAENYCITKGTVVELECIGISGSVFIYAI